MSKRKTVSADEKKTRMVELLMEKAEPFTLKELTTLAQKLKGIRSQTVKEVLQSLVDDNAIDSDKIGNTIYYWCFPSSGSVKKGQQLAELEKKVESRKRDRDQIEQDLKKLESGRSESDERKAKKMKLIQLEKENDQLNADLAKYSDLDPEVVKEMKQNAQIAQDAVNRWTENIYTLQKYCSEVMNVDATTFRQAFDIPEDLDYI